MIVQNTVRGRDTDISFTVPNRRPPGRGRDGADAATNRCLGSGGGRQRGPGLARRGRDEVAPGHRGDHVRDAGRGGHQHRHDLHLDDPDLVHRGTRTTSNGRCAACIRRSPWADGGWREAVAHAVAAPARQGGDRPAPGRLGLRPRAGPPGAARRRRLGHLFAGTEKGRGRALKSVPRPAVALVSPAARTAATADLVLADLVHPPERRLDDALYGADPEEVLAASARPARRGRTRPWSSGTTPRRTRCRRAC